MSFSVLIGYIDTAEAPRGDVCITDGKGRALVVLSPDEYHLTDDGGVCITSKGALIRMSMSCIGGALEDMGENLSDLEDTTPRRFDA